MHENRFTITRVELHAGAGGGVDVDLLLIDSPSEAAHAEPMCHEAAALWTRAVAAGRVGDIAGSAVAPEDFEDIGAAVTFSQLRLRLRDVAGDGVGTYESRQREQFLERVQLDGAISEKT